MLFNIKAKKSFSICIFVAFFLLQTLVVFADPSFDNVINHYAPNSHVGIIVGDAKTGKIIYEKNGFGLFTPASNMKLFTAAAALYSLGPKYQFKTEVGIHTKNLQKHTLNDNLYIRFSGDPSLTTQNLQQLIQDIKKYGIDSINGDIVLDTTIFDKPDYGREWSLEEINWSYGSPVTSIILDENALRFSIVPAKTVGEKPTITLVDPEKASYIKIDNQLQTVPHEQALHHCTTDIQIDQDNTIHLRGCVSIDPEDSLEGDSFALRNPLAYATAVVQNSLVEHNIQLKGKIVIGKIPADVNFIVKVNSAPLYKLVGVMLKKSNNLFAESFAKTMGYMNSQHGTFQEGINAMEKILKPKTNIDFTKIKICDGSGLSHDSLLTPRSIYRLLYVVFHDKKIKDYFIPALANPGGEGTLKKRLTSFDSAEFINAKTGTILGVSSLSGYLTTQSGRQLIFSILINNIDDLKQAKILENELCLAFLRLKI